MDDDALNNAPVVIQQFYTTAFPQGTTIYSLLHYFSDPDGDALTFTATSSDHFVFTVEVVGDPQDHRPPFDFHITTETRLWSAGGSPPSPSPPPMAAYR